MRVGVFLPISGRSAGPETLTEAAQKAEEWGFASVWAADRLVIPWTIETPYPYADGEAFIVPPDRPFLETLTCLAYLAGRTRRVRLGVSVLVLPYRHPLHWAKVVSTIDRLSHGRFVLGVGVGWMREEFAALGADFESRGKVADEQLQLWDALMSDDHVDFDGDTCRVDDIAFLPKSTSKPRIPVWVGGEGGAARQRAARFGDAWFPYHVSVSAEELGVLRADVERRAAGFGREPSAVALNACRPIELTSEPVPQDPTRLRGTSDQLLEALVQYAEVGVDELALQFMVPRYPERMAQIEAFATDVLPHLP